MSTPPKKRSGPRRLGEFTRATMDPIAAKLGFGEADILMNWPAIAGERLAAVSEPERLQWPARAPNRPPEAPAEPASLVLRIEGAFALEAQHLAPQLIERINARLGWRCVGRILFRQGPVRKAAAARQRPKPPDRQAQARAADIAAPIEDEGLRAALTRLGARALSRSKPG